MILHITILALVMLASFFNGFMDELHFRAPYRGHPWKDNRFLNPDLSWVNKYLFYEPDCGPRFFGSTTFLVFLTDGWHLGKMLMWACLQLAIILATGIDFPWIDWPIWSEYMLGYFLLWFIRSTTFHLTFHFIFTEHNIRAMNRFWKTAWSWIRAIYPSAPSFIAIAIGAVLFILFAGLSELAPWMDYVITALLVVSWAAAMKLLINRLRHPRKPEEG